MVGPLINKNSFVVSKKIWLLFKKHFELKSIVYFLRMNELSNNINCAPKAAYFPLNVVNSLLVAENCKRFSQLGTLKDLSRRAG